RDPDRQTAESHIRIIRHCRSDQWRDMAHSSTASTNSAKPRSSTSPKFSGEGGSSSSPRVLQQRLTDPAKLFRLIAGC
ncbi:hypothetical protein, partial [Rhodovulum sulfidophilum]|uniref:hypothetical protein n=1 Tax=Rhodovulum sulfidophilum TaxID=35806 RepID=UPI001F184333